MGLKGLADKRGKHWAHTTKHLISNSGTSTVTETMNYRVRINYRRILQNHIFTNTEQKYMMFPPFERGMFAVS